MKSLVILPSYNERENILLLVDSILNLGPQFSICVVDDNSPDGTSELVGTRLSKLPIEDRGRLHLITRNKKDGRGGAVRVGMKWGLQKDHECFVEMDCDFSHPPYDILRGVELLKTADVVMGSRYPDGKIIGWPIKRKILSFFANTLARSLINWKIADYTNGFRFYTRKAAEFICQKPQTHKGYIYLSETISYFLNAGYKIHSFPIVFVNRERGKSNTSIREVTSAFTGIFLIAWGHWSVGTKK